jgi:3-(3-hydroxy-phenyl)propionate hydroxylase
MTDYDVAIVGAGPTGLTLANLLGRAGCRVLLVERNTTTVAEPRAVSIDDEALRTMQAIGLVDDVIRDIALDYGSYYFSASGRQFLTVEPSTREYGFPRRNAFAQPKLEAVLRLGLQRFPNVATLFGWHCETVAEHADGVTVTLARGGERRALQARYLVGADGARSAIRKHIGATLSGSTYRQRWLIVDLAATRERLRQTRVVCNPDRPLITLPGPGGTRRYEFMLFDGEDEAAAVEPDFVHALLAAHGPDAEAPIVRRQVYTFHARLADRWRAGRILLAGDAAHLSPPFAGQGMNSGLRDAFNLGWKLAAIVKGRLGEGLLDSYQVERAPHAWALIELAMMMGRIMMPGSHLQAWAVRSGFRATQLIPAVQSYFAQMKYKPKPFYRDGFVLASDDGIAGRMLPQPQVELRDRSRVLLDEMLGDGFCLLAYGAEAQQVAAFARELDFGIAGLHSVAVLPRIINPDPDAPPDLDTVRDHAGAFDAVLPNGGLVLVRPDRHVAAASTAEPDKMRALAAAVKAMGARTWAAGDAA